MSTSPRAVATLVFAVFALTAQITSAQGQFDSVDGYYEDASKRIAEGDTNGAIIQIKNALQIDPDHLPSMLLMGDAYVAAGQPGNARTAYNDALLLGASAETLIPKLIDIYLSLGSYSELLTAISPDGQPPLLRADILAAHGEALLGIGNTSAALERARASLLIRETPRALKVQALVEVRRGLAEQALDSADAITKQFPTYSGGWAAKAAAFEALGRRTDAIDAYTMAIEVNPADIDASVALISLLLATSEWGRAQPYIDILRQQYPLDPRGAYFGALVAADQGDTAQEKELLREASGLVDALIPEVRAARPQLLAIGALSYFGLASFEQARAYAEQYLQSNAGDVGMEKLLAVSLLELKAETIAIQRLSTLVRRDQADPELTRLLATAYAQDEQYARAAELLATIENNGGAAPGLRRMRGSILMNAGRTDLGIPLLMTAFEQQPSSSLAIALTAALINAGRAPEAVELAQEALTRQPDNLALKNLTAVALLTGGEQEKAAALWQAMLAADPAFSPASINLAKVSRELGDLDAASEWLGTLSEQDAELTVALIERSKLALAKGELDDALRVAERAVQQNQTDVEAATLLVELYLVADNAVAAEETARRCSAANQGSFAASTLLAQTFALTGQINQARLVYTQMSRSADFDPVTLHRIAILQANLGDYQSALNSLNSAVQGDASYQPARFMQLQMLLENNLLEDLQTAGRQYQQDFEQDARGLLMRAEGQLRTGNFVAAEREFKRAETAGALADAMLGLYRVYSAQNRDGDGLAALQRGLAAFPDNLRLLAALSDAQISSKNWSAALSTLTEILAMLPESATHLHNRAIVKQQLGAPGAISDARSAQALAPDVAAFNDTLGWLLTSSGNAYDGLRYLREAIARDGRNPQFAYHLAYALAELGRTREALAELYGILQADDVFTEREEAQALQDKLQNQT